MAGENKLSDKALKALHGKPQQSQKMVAGGRGLSVRVSVSGTVSFVYFFRHSGRQPECRAMTTLSNSTRWRMEQEGKFPKRIKIGPSAVAYRLSEVQVWIRGEWVSL